MKRDWAKHFVALLLVLLLGSTLFGCGESFTLELDTSGVRQYFLSGDAFSTDGLQIYKVSASGEKKAVPVADCKVEAPDMSSRGEKTVTVSYRGQSATYPVWLAKEQKKSDKISVLYEGYLMFDCYLVGENKPFVLILSGGGYGSVSDSIEGQPVAEAINALGYNAFVLKYGTGKNGAYPQPQNDVAFAVHMILQYAEHFGVSPEDWAIMGYSAGGHLAASWCTKTVGYAQYGLPRPSAALLCYPVVSMGEHGHAFSRKQHLGESPAQEMIDLLSVEKNIDGDYPPTFLWVGTGDQEVDIANSRMFDEALTANNVTHRYTEYEGVAHGVGLAKGTAAENWLSEAIAFWQAN